MMVQTWACWPSSAYRTGRPPASVPVPAGGVLDGSLEGDGLLDGLLVRDGLAVGCVPAGDGLLTCCPVVLREPGVRELAGRGFFLAACVAAAEADCVAGRPALARWACWRAAAVDLNGSSVTSTT